MEIIAYTDGSVAPKNPGPGGWGFHYFYKTEDGLEFDWEDYGGEKYSTNQRMEMIAIIQCVKNVPIGNLTVHSDSQYCLKGIVEGGKGKFCKDRMGWTGKWIKDGWKTASKQPVKNIELWQEMLAVCNKYLENGGELCFTWTKGHNGDEGNERADRLAEMGRVSQLN